MISIDRFGMATLSADEYGQLRDLLAPANPCDESLVPGHTRETLDAYARTGLPVGGFLEAVLAHDLFEAVNRADTPNLRALPAIVAYVYNHLPTGSHGSREHYRAYLRDADTQRMARGWAESKVL